MDIGTLLDFTGIRYLWSKISPYIADEYASKADVENIASAVGSGLAFKGAVAAVADLPDTGNEAGDMYSVTASAPDGGNYAWDGTQWVKLAETVDTSMFALDADVVHLAGAETIGGAKTFSAPIIGDLDGTAKMALKDGAGNVIASTYATTAVATDQISGLMSAADKGEAGRHRELRQRLRPPAGGLRLPWRGADHLDCHDYGQAHALPHHFGRGLLRCRPRIGGHCGLLHRRPVRVGGCHAVSE